MLSGILNSDKAINMNDKCAAGLEPIMENIKSM
jgi:hypothetical protein